MTHLTGWGGEVIEKYSYDAFGAPSTTYTRGSFNNRFKFTGREYVSAFGIYEYRNRAYHPGIGRFMSEDPKGFDGSDYNLFSYVQNDPLDLSDPMGLSPQGSEQAPLFVPEEKVYTVKVIDSLIPIPIKLTTTTSGNWADKNVDHHVASDGDMGEKGGKTVAVTSVTGGDRAFNVNLDLNWWVKARFTNTDVVIREIRDHIKHWREWWTEGNGRETITGFAGKEYRGSVAAAQTHLKNIMKSATISQFSSQDRDFDRKGKAHDLNFFPAQEQTPAEMANALSLLR